jgi:hypothetical protein
VNLFLQTLQEKGSSPVCILICLFRLQCWEHNFLYNSNEICLPSLCTVIRRIKSEDWLNLSLHNSHGNVVLQCVFWDVPWNVQWFAVYEIVSGWFALRFEGNWEPDRTYIEFFIQESLFSFVFQFPNPGSWCSCCIMYSLLYESLNFAQPCSLLLLFSAIWKESHKFISYFCVHMHVYITHSEYLWIPLLYEPLQLGFFYFIFILYLIYLQSVQVQ